MHTNVISSIYLFSRSSLWSSNPEDVRQHLRVPCNQVSGTKSAFPTEHLPRCDRRSVQRTHNHTQYVSLSQPLLVLLLLLFLLLFYHKHMFGAVIVADKEVLRMYIPPVPVLPVVYYLCPSVCLSFSVCVCVCVRERERERERERVFNL